MEYLYKAFMGRSSDSTGKKSWIARLEAGKTREEVFNGFAMSDEFKSLCADYGIVRGQQIAVPVYGTMPTGSCSVCGEIDGVTAFVTRLYETCLGREPDAAGLKSWTEKLRNHTITGAQAAYGFIFSKEFTGRNYSNADYVEHLYLAFLGRASDAAGKAGWVRKLASGTSRKKVFDGFVGSSEFTNICRKYGIIKE